MIGSKINKIYRIDGQVNSTVVETNSGLYSISGNGFFAIDNEYLKGHKSFTDVNLKGVTITEVKSSFEFTVLKLSNGDFLIHHVDTPFITVESSLTIKEDKEFLDWYQNDLQLLTNERHFAILKSDRNC